MPAMSMPARAAEVGIVGLGVMGETTISVTARVVTSEPDRQAPTPPAERRY